MKTSTWRTVRIGEIADVNPGRDPVLKTLADEVPVTFVPMAAVEETSGTIAAPEVRPFAEVKKGFTPFLEGDVLFAKITPCMQNGKSAVARDLSNGIGFGSTEFHVMRPGREVLADWLWHFVRQASFRREAESHFRGSAGQQRVPAEFLASHPIPLPPVQEQRRILSSIEECLERVEEVRRLKEEAEDELRRLQSAVLREAVEEVRNSAQAREIHLGDIVVHAQYGTSQKASPTGSGIPILRMGNLQDGHLHIDDLKYVEMSSKEAARYLLRSGDLLINRTNSLELVGKAAVFAGVEGDWVFASYLVRIRLDESVAVPEYVSAYINGGYGRRYIEGTARRAIGMVNINLPEMKRMPLLLPSREKQLQIVTRLSSVRGALDRVTDEYLEREADALRGAVLRKAFAGQL